MSFFQIDDKFLGHHKTKRALRKGAEALQMWLALRTYVATNETDGFIPDEDIDDLSGAPRSPRKWLRVLVECGKPLTGGGRGAGLVDPVENGWRLHNYGKHGLTREQIEARRKATRERVERWRNKTHGNATSNAPKVDVSNASGNAVTNGSPSHPIPSHKDADASSGAGARDGSGSPPNSASETLAMPIAVRAGWCMRRGDVADWVEPETWPEVVSAAELCAKALGLHVPRLGKFSRDAAVRAIVAIFAAGYTLADFEQAAARIPADPYLSNGRKRLSALTLEVFRNLLSGANDNGSGAQHAAVLTP